MKPRPGGRKCPMQGDICRVIPVCPEAAISYVPDEAAPLGGHVVFDDGKCND